MSERNVHQQFARAYRDAERDYEWAAQRGDEKRMEDALARKQALERGVTITVHNREVLA